MTRLFAIMGLQAAQRGLWYIPFVLYMDKVLVFSGLQISAILGTGALASMICPGISGWLADRFLPAHRLYVVIQLVGAAALVGAFFCTSFPGLLLLVFIENIAFVGGVTLSNAITFRNLPDPSRFGDLAVGGTIGWMVASWVMSAVLVVGGDAALRASLLVGGGFHLVVAGAGLLLPASPPESRGSAADDRDHLGDLLRQPGLAVLLLAAATTGFCFAALHSYTPLRLVDAGMAEGAVQAWMTLGQVSEIVAMLLLGWMHRRFGLKITMLCGLAAIVMRLLITGSSAPVAALVAAQLLHGIEFAFAAVSIAIAAERLSRPETRARAQALAMFALWGAGRLLGFLASGWLYDAFPGDDRWMIMFGLPALLMAGVWGLYAFRFPRRETGPAAPGSAAQGRRHALNS